MCLCVCVCACTCTCLSSSVFLLPCFCLCFCLCFSTSLWLCNPPPPPSLPSQIYGSSLPPPFPPPHLPHALPTNSCLPLPCIISICVSFSLLMSHLLFISVSVLFAICLYIICVCVSGCERNAVECTKTEVDIVCL